MPHQARLNRPGTLHHAIARGLERGAYFCKACKMALPKCSAYRPPAAVTSFSSTSGGWLVKRPWRANPPGADTVGTNGDTVGTGGSRRAPDWGQGSREKPLHDASRPVPRTHPVPRPHVDRISWRMKQA